MAIGLGIFLLALGAILTFAVDAHVNGLDLAATWVMAAGALGILLEFIMLAPRRRAVRTTTVADPYAPRSDRDVY